MCQQAAQLSRPRQDGLHQALKYIHCKAVFMYIHLRYCVALSKTHTYIQFKSVTETSHSLFIQPFEILLSMTTKGLR